MAERLGNRIALALMAIASLTIVSVNRTAYADNTQARCSKAVAVLTRVHNPQGAQLAREIPVEWIHKLFVADLQRANLDVVDIFELSGVFQDLKVEDSCSHVGADSCGHKSLSFSEAIITAIDEIEKGLEHVDSDDFNATKLRPLAKGGVLLALQVEINQARNQVKVITFLENKRLSDRNDAWDLPTPPSKPASLRTAPARTVAEYEIRRLSKLLASDVAKACH